MLSILNILSYIFLLFAVITAAIEAINYFCSLFFCTDTEEERRRTEVVFPLILFVGAAVMKYFALL